MRKLSISLSTYFPNPSLKVSGVSQSQWEVKIQSCNAGAATYSSIKKIDFAWALHKHIDSQLIFKGVSI